MTSEDRRSFLKRLAQTAAYTAPVVTSLAAPLDLVAQGKTSQHKHGHGHGHGHGPPPAPPASQSAPWDQPPPGAKP